MTKKIMIIGGHGHVGKIITRELVKIYPYQIVIAGRNERMMADFSAELKEQIKYQFFDLDALLNPSIFFDVSLIIMCMDQTNLEFIRFCIESEIDYLDISANSSLYQQLEQLPQASNSNLIFSVGLAPGISNLMAEQLVQINPTVERVVIDIMLGLGDSHGKAAINWTLSRMNERYQFKNSAEIIESFSEGHQVNFNGEIGKKCTYRFNFPDQHTLREVHSKVTFDTYLGFDSVVATKGIHYLKKIKLLKVLEIKEIQNFSEKLMKRNKLGTDKFAVKVTASLTSGEKFTLSVQGEKEATITGRVAALVAEKIFDHPVKSGIQHIDEICTFTEILEKIPDLKLISEVS